MSQIEQNKGICSTCTYQGGCLFQQASRFPVWFCDHFRTEAEPAAARAPLTAGMREMDPAASDR